MAMGPAEGVRWAMILTAALGVAAGGLFLASARFLPDEMES
jgi:hypothetical protein